MSVMVIYMHPTEDSLNGALLAQVLEEIPEAVLYRPGVDGFDPHLTHQEYKRSMDGDYEADVAEAAKDLQAADHVIFMFPLWWGGFPAAGKGFIDRVFAYGAAYELEGEEPVPKLTGKASLVFTTGTPEDVFHEEGLYDNVVEGLDKHLLSFCGLELMDVVHFGDVIQASDEKRADMLNHLREKAAAWQRLHGNESTM